MSKYEIITTDEQDELLTKTGLNIQEVLENRISELEEQGRRQRRNELADAYEKAEPADKVQIDNIVEAVKEAEQLKDAEDLQITE